MSIRLESVNFIYNYGRPGEHTALRDVSLLFEDRGFTALIGKTGSGKSTLIQHLNGLLTPTSGIVEIGDTRIDHSLVYKKKKGGLVVDVRAMKKKDGKKVKGIKELRKRVGLVFQFPEYQIFEETVLKDVSYGPKNFGRKDEEAKEDAKKALSLVGLDESFYDRSPFELSGGEKRRVAIAGILALKPETLVLDEPTVGLDAEGEQSLLRLLSSIEEKGTAIILATHDMDVVLKYAQRVLVLEQGQVVKDTTPLLLFQDESFLRNSSLEPPKVFGFALRLKKAGLDLDLSQVKDTSTLADEILRAKGRTA